MSGCNIGCSKWKEKKVIGGNSLIFDCDICYYCFVKVFFNFFGGFVKYWMLY